MALIQQTLFNKYLYVKLNSLLDLTSIIIHNNSYPQDHTTSHYILFYKTNALKEFFTFIQDKKTQKDFVVK